VIRAFLSFLFLSLIFIAGCPPKQDIRQAPNEIPQGLLPIATIEGEVLGQKLSGPIGIEADDFGDLYLVDAGNSRLVKFDREFKAVRDVGGFGRSDGLLNSPTYLGIDNNLNLYIADAGNQRVSVYDSRLNFAEEISLIDDTDPLRFGRPSGIIVNRYGELWVADYDKAQILIFNNVHQFSRVIGGRENSIGLLLNPEGMAVSPPDRILVCDAGNGVIKVFDNIGVHQFTFGGDYLEYPTGVDVDRFGNIWVCDRDLNKVFCFNRSGDYLYSIGEEGRDGVYGMESPSDLTVAWGDKLIISDKGNNRLLVYDILFPE